jgi:hypothetical protein
MDDNTMKRLALIKYLHSTAIKQSCETEPLCGLSVLGFQDSIELFLQVACEKLNVPVNPKKEPAFMEYFQLIREKSTISLSQETAIGRLNKARVAFKHHGNMPSKIDIEAFRVTANNFFEDNTPLVFDLQFADISMANLIESDDARNSLIESIDLLNKADNQGAIEKVALAYGQLMRHFHSKHKDRFGRSPYNLRYDFSFREISRQADLNNAVSHIGKQLEHMGSVIELLLLGIDIQSTLDS